MQAETLTLPDGYSRLKTKPQKQYRAMTPEEAKSLSYGRRIPFCTRQGEARELKVNGAPKTWKRDLSRVEVPAKYGMYETGTFVSRGDRMESFDGSAFLLVEVTP